MRDMLRVVHEQNQTIHALLGTVDRYRDAIETYRADAVQLGYAVAPNAAPPAAAAVAPPAAWLRPASPRRRRGRAARRRAAAAAAVAPPAAAAAPPAATPPSPDRAPQSPAYDFAHVINPMPAKGTAGRTPAHIEQEVTFAAMARARARAAERGVNACGC